MPVQRDAGRRVVERQALPGQLILADQRETQVALGLEHPATFAVEWRGQVDLVAPVGVDLDRRVGDAVDTDHADVVVPRCGDPRLLLGSAILERDVEGCW